MDLDLRQLLNITRRWWWLFLLAPLAAGASAYVSSSRQQPLYSASTTLQVNPPQTATSTDLSALQGSKSLAETYRQLITTRTVLGPVVQTLDLPYDVATLEEKISASAVGDTQLIRISASDTSPAQAAALANAVAQQFVTHISSRAAQLASPYRATLDQQIKEAAGQIDKTRTQIQTLEKDPNAASATIQDQLALLRPQLSQTEQSYRELIVAANEMDRSAASAQTQITIEDPAVPPESPYAPKTKLYTILGAFAGLCLAVGGIAFFEYLDNTVKGELDFPQVFGLPMLSMIGNMPKLQPGRKQLFALNDPKSGATEAVRLLRTNLEFAAATDEIATLAITSAGPGEGKSTITANLAITMAQAGFATVIIDADLRRPSQHKIWGVANDRGLSTLLTRSEHPWRWASVNEIAPNLSLIPSGPVPPNPADLLSLDRFRALIEEISQSVNVVVIDTPPVLAVSDPLIVATGVDAVAIVTHAGRTRIDALRHAIGTLSQGSVRLAGVILNHSTVRDSGNYYYYSGYYGPSDQSTTTGSTPSKNGGLKRPERSSGTLTAPPVSAEQ